MMDDYAWFVYKQLKREMIRSIKKAVDILISYEGISPEHVMEATSLITEPSENLIRDPNNFIKFLEGYIAIESNLLGKE